MGSAGANPIGVAGLTLGGYEVAAGDVAVGVAVAAFSFTGAALASSAYDSEVKRASAGPAFVRE